MGKPDPIAVVTTGHYRDAIRLRLKMIQKVATTTGHCVITDEEDQEGDGIAAPTFTWWNSASGTANQ